MKRYSVVQGGRASATTPHDVDTCQTTLAGNACDDCEQAICQRCGQYKDSDPSDIPGDDLCGSCRVKQDGEEEQS